MKDRVGPLTDSFMRGSRSLAYLQAGGRRDGRVPTGVCGDRAVRRLRRRGLSSDAKDIVVRGAEQHHGGGWRGRVAGGRGEVGPETVRTTSGRSVPAVVASLVCFELATVASRISLAPGGESIHGDRGISQSYGNRRHSIG